VPVRLKGIVIERSRRFGDVYLALALWRGTGLEELCERLLPLGQERMAWAKMADVLVAARLCEPSSELHIAEGWSRRTALCDLLQLGEEEITKDRLYRGLDHLLAHKAALEAHLSKRCGELFAIDNEVLLYDVTSTYRSLDVSCWGATIGRSLKRTRGPITSGAEAVAPPFQTLSQIGNVITELPAGPAAVLSINGSFGAVGGRAFRKTHFCLGRRTRSALRSRQEAHREAFS
jgi:hypothetical protein